MFLYQLTLVVPEKKFDEFIESLQLLSGGIREEQECLDFSLYRDLATKDAYRVSGEWQTRQAMEAHFKREKFSVLIGAAWVLDQDFEMSCMLMAAPGLRSTFTPQPWIGSELRKNSRYKVIPRST